MASSFNIRARLELEKQTINLEAAAGAVAGGGARGTVKLMLLQSTYPPDHVAHDLADNGGANDPVDHELSVSGYTGGYNGSGRKAVSGSLSPVWARDNPNARVEYDFTDPAAWTALAAGQTIGFVGLVCEDFVGTAGNDTETLYIATDDTNNVATNGGDITYAVNSEGLLQL